MDPLLPQNTPQEKQSWFQRYSADGTSIPSLDPNQLTFHLNLDDLDDMFPEIRNYEKPSERSSALPVSPLLPIQTPQSLIIDLGTNTRSTLGEDIDTNSQISCNWSSSINSMTIPHDQLSSTYISHSNSSASAYDYESPHSPFSPTIQYGSNAPLTDSKNAQLNSDLKSNSPLFNWSCFLPSPQSLNESQNLGVHNFPSVRNPNINNNAQQQNQSLNLKNQNQNQNQNQNLPHMQFDSIEIPSRNNDNIIIKTETENENENELIDENIQVDPMTLIQEQLTALAKEEACSSSSVPKRKRKSSKQDSSSKFNSGDNQPNINNNRINSINIKNKWSVEETNNLIIGCKIWGVGNWKKILNDSTLSFNNRTATDLKDRFRYSFPNEYHKLYPNARTHKRKRASSCCVIDTNGTGSDVTIDSSDSRSSSISAGSYSNSFFYSPVSSCSPLTDTPSPDPLFMITPSQQQQQHHHHQQQRQAICQTIHLGIIPPTQLSRVVRRTRHAFTPEEDKHILLGFKKYGTSWNSIQSDASLKLGHRNRTDIRDRFRNKYTELYDLLIRNRKKKGRSTSIIKPQVQNSKISKQ